MKIAIGADTAGFTLKEAVKTFLQDAGYEVEDLTETDCRPYYETAGIAAAGIGKKIYDRAVLFCGTGMGMSIVANKHKGVYASCVESVYAATKCRIINNANVLCMGGFIVGAQMGIDMTKAFLETEFLQGTDPALRKFLIGAYSDIEAFDARQFAQ